MGVSEESEKEKELGPERGEPREPRPTAEPEVVVEGAGPGVPEVLPVAGETALIAKLERFFGEDRARDIARMIQVVAMRRLHSVVSWAEYFLSKLDISGIKTRVTIERHLGTFSYEVTIRLSVEDVDPIVIRRNIKELYRAARLGRDEAKYLERLERYMWALIRQEALRGGEEEEEEEE
jgi:hypothetical protein